MSKMILTRGVPASGKSTWAKQWVAEDPANRVRVNRDNLRWTLGIREGVGTYEQEQEVTHWQDEMIRRALKNGKDVVVDNTNLRARNVKDLLKIAKAHNAEVEFKDFSITLEQATFRDAQRQANGERYVGADVIKGFFDKFMQKGQFPAIPVLEDENDLVFRPYQPGKLKAMSFDIDGTLAKMVSRGPYDTSLYHTDDCHTQIRELLWLAADSGYEIIILSGRSDEFEEVLVEWLADFEIYPNAIFMRAEGDTRNDAIVKSELVDNYISNVYDVVVHFDDRNRVVDALRAKGMKVAQVEPGDF